MLNNKIVNLIDKVFGCDFLPAERDHPGQAVAAEKKQANGKGGQNTDKDDNPP